jgi:hypothetical protein
VSLLDENTVWRKVGYNLLRDKHREQIQLATVDHLSKVGFAELLRKHRAACENWKATTAGSNHWPPHSRITSGAGIAGPLDSGSLMLVARFCQLFQKSEKLLWEFSILTRARRYLSGVDGADLPD